VTDDEEERAVERLETLKMNDEIVLSR